MDVPPRPLVAVDANVLMDLGAEFDPVIDAIQIIQVRLTSPRLVIPPTPQQELAHIARHADTTEDRNRALCGISAARRWRIVPVNLMPVWSRWPRPLNCSLARVRPQMRQKCPMHVFAQCIAA